MHPGFATGNAQRSPTATGTRAIGPQLFPAGRDVASRESERERQRACFDCQNVCVRARGRESVCPRTISKVGAVFVKNFHKIRGNIYFCKIIIFSHNRDTILRDTSIF